MVRRYHDAIEVRVITQPQSFLWRGRIFLIEDIHGQWSERRQWWRSHEPARERQLWRVHASAGQSHSGVFDLALDGDQWLLVQAHD